ncbi:MAG: alpha/beta hydrolase [Litorivicinaceae bacterium]
MQIQPTIQVIEGPAGALEVATLGVESCPSVTRGLLLLHPHPLHGGSMANKIITTLARLGRDSQIPTFALNFRGVGGSEGIFDHGFGEVDDALAVARFGWQMGVREWMLAGFSFGAAMAGRLVPRLHAESLGRVVDLLQVAPAVENFPIPLEPLADIPKAILFNTDDDVVSPAAMQAYVEASAPQWTSIHASGGHFYHGELFRLKQEVFGYWQSRGFVADARD